MANLLGIVLFALGICLTVALHEAGHMLTARAFGMRVRRFFIGFGPTLWSFKKNETEYGVAALPLGGFCDIAGMTAQDEFITEEERPYAMYKKPWWQRIIVLSGGVAVNIILGFMILFVVAQTAGLPN
ncbi:MAG: site-2 protease family protein, partial [Corynebacterium casei]|nr:site-2 protease family protein [Corynebacterium casei]